MSRHDVHAELAGARAAFHRLVEDATATELRRPSEGTRWTHEQLLFHMLSGYLIARALLDHYAAGPLRGQHACPGLDIDGYPC